MSKVSRSALLLWLFLPARLWAAEAEPSVLVETGKLQQSPVETVVRGVGSVTPGVEGLVDLSFQHAGQIRRLLVRTGQPVARGTPLVELDADPAVLVGFAKAQSALQTAKRELEQAKALREQHLATNAQVGAAQQAYDDAASDLLGKKYMGDGEPRQTLTAPFEGFVDSIAVAAGDRIQAGAPVLKVGQGIGLQAVVGLQPEDATSVCIGDPVRVTPVFGGKAPLAGRIAGVSQSLNATTRWVDVTIDLDALPSDLIAGTPIRAEVITSEHSGYVVPRQAVLQDNQGSYIFQVTGGRARRVGVRLGEQTDQRTEVSGPFDPALPVVTVGNYELHDGMPVRKADAPSNAAGSPR